MASRGHLRKLCPTERSKAYWRLRFGGRRHGCAAELCVVGLCGQEEAHQARRFSGRDGGGRAVVGFGSAHRAVLSKGWPAGWSATVSHRCDVAHLLPATVVLP